jgi:phage baseplate assembly protein W
VGYSFISSKEEGEKTMTGKYWNAYFESLTDEYKKKLHDALQTLDGDPMFQKAYGTDFKQLWHMIEYPLSKKPEPTQEQIGQWLKAAYR